MALIEVNHFWPNGLGNTRALPAPFRPSQASITAFCGNINKDHNLKLRFSTSCTWSVHSGIRSGQNEESSSLHPSRPVTQSTGLEGRRFLKEQQLWLWKLCDSHTDAKFIWHRCLQGDSLTPPSLLGNPRGYSQRLVTATSEPPRMPL